MPVHKLEALVCWRSKRWVASWDGLEVEAETAAELDDKVIKVVCSSMKYARGDVVTVVLRCDRSVIPDWVRPYQQHYFNRRLTFTV